MSPEKWLVCFDTDRVKNYLFATPVLSDIRQASGLLDRLNARRGDKGPGVRDIADAIQDVYPNFNRGDPEQCIYAAGGSALMILPDERTAREAIQAVERLYRRETVVASITGVYIQISQDDLQERFGQKVREAGYLLRQRKAEKGRGRILPVGPYMHFCDACAQLPAAYYDLERDELICRACQAKRRPADVARRWLWKKLTRVAKGGPDDAPDAWESLLHDTVGDTTHEKLVSPDDFDDIGNSSRRQGYIALIYADGNRMGQVLEQLPDPRAYSRFAKLVDDLLLRVLYRSLMRQVRQQPKKPLFELLMAGGDDLMLVTTPDIAFQAALGIMRDFEQYSKPLVEPYGVDFLSLGTGLVIAHARYPIAAMQQLATELQKRAKRRSFEEGGTGAVDFAVVTATDSEDLERIREHVLTQEGFTFPPADKSKYWLTQRPYTLDELKGLLECQRKLKESGFPRSQLQMMYEALFHSPAQASLAAIQTLGRVQDRHKKPLWDFFQRFGSPPPRTLPPWRERLPRGRDSALGDLVEIYPFL